jgi:hypothetical protein
MSAAFIEYISPRKRQQIMKKVAATGEWSGKVHGWKLTVIRFKNVIETITVPPPTPITDGYATVGEALETFQRRISARG